MQPRIPRKVFDLLNAFRHAWRSRGQRSQLQGMSERELRDLGIGRSEVPGLFVTQIRQRTRI